MIHMLRVFCVLIAEKIGWLDFVDGKIVRNYTSLNTVLTQKTSWAFKLIFNGLAVLILIEVLFGARSAIQPEFKLGFRMLLVLIGIATLYLLISKIIQFDFSLISHRKSKKDHNNSTGGSQRG